MSSKSAAGAAEANGGANRGVSGEGETRAGANDGDLLSHHTWHPLASPNNSDKDPMRRGPHRSLHGSPDGGRPRSSSSSRKSGFNMKGLLRSVSTHSFARRTESDGPGHSRKAAERLEKGWLLERQGKLDEAELMYSRHCMRSQKHHGRDSLQHANNVDRLVHLLFKEGKLAEAEPLARRVVDIKRKALGENNEQVATAMVNLGRVLEEKGQYTDALIYLRKGLTTRETVLGEDHPDTVSALAWIGDIHCKQDEYSEALVIAKKVAAAHEARLGPNDIKVASSLNNLAALMATMGHTDEALPLFKRSNEIYVRLLGEQHPHSVGTLLWVQQLSAPPPPARRRSSRPAGDAGAAGEDRLAVPPPPLMEEDVGEEHNVRQLSLVPENAPTGEGVQNLAAEEHANAGDEIERQEPAPSDEQPMYF